METIGTRKGRWTRASTRTLEHACQGPAWTETSCCAAGFLTHTSAHTDAQLKFTAAWWTSKASPHFRNMNENCINITHTFIQSIHRGMTMLFFSKTNIPLSFLRETSDTQEAELSVLTLFLSFFITTKQLSHFNILNAELNAYCNYYQRFRVKTGPARKI